MTKIYSMTGFGHSEIVGKVYSVTCEIKTVNNRFKDIRFKMGSIFNSKEMEFKKLIELDFKRGSFDIMLNYKKSEGAQSFDMIDTKKIDEYLAKIIPVIKKQNLNIELKPTDFLRGEFYIDRGNEMEEELHGLGLKAIKEAILKLKKSREEEGNKLVETLKDHFLEYSKAYEKISGFKSGYQELVREKLLKKFKEEKELKNIDENRFLQEVVYYLEKLDIDEEIGRVKIHLSKVDKIFKDGGEVGKPLDFLLQELGRETNTIGSKAQKVEISECVVSMKVHLEKIREQTLNLE